jgi:hypothetical protein
VGEWQELAEALVELDIQIEDLEGWATRPEDVDRLKELEALRDQVGSAIAFHHIPAGLHRRLRARDGAGRLRSAATDPRD